MKAWTVIALLLFLASGSALGQQTVTGIVSQVFDGDSLIVDLSDQRSVEIRLAEIDAPEQYQPYAEEARAALRQLLLEQRVDIELFDVDSYSRAVARVWRYEDRLYINAWMVEHGYAWVYPRYAEDEALDDLQQSAIAGNIGLWSLAEGERIPPWQWRRSHTMENGALEKEAAEAAAE